MANHKIEDVEGIGLVIGEKLRAVGIKDTDAFLAACHTPKQRQTLAAESGLSEAKVLKFANMIDLFRVHGVGAEYAELLEAAGVDTVPELARRNAANLATALHEINEQKNLTRRLPSETQLAKWIEEAKALPRVLSY